MMKTEVIKATVKAAPFLREKLASVAMLSENGVTFDAKAFLRSPQAMQALAGMRMDDIACMSGHWETNPDNGRTTFIVDTATNDTANIITPSSQALGLAPSELASQDDDKWYWPKGPHYWDGGMGLRFGMGDMSPGQYVKGAKRISGRKWQLADGTVIHTPCCHDDACQCINGQACIHRSADDEF